MNPNWLAAFQNFRGVEALPAVMSCSAARLRPSRPNVERLRASAYGFPPTVAVPITEPCTDFLNFSALPASWPASKSFSARHLPL